ncbi:MAG: DUF1942 domain-containing protein [Actinomycetota bacterium]|nr:DUF1942 domain-containing protein [Actinomycetota bacterium]
MSETQEFADLRQLFQDGLLTETEHAQATQKLAARSPADGGMRGPAHGGGPALPDHPPRRPTGSHRRARTSGRRLRTWLVSTGVFALALALGALITLSLSKHSTSPAARTRGAASTGVSTPTVSPLPVRTGSPLDQGEAVNLNGATATITVSDLKIDSPSPRTDTKGTAYSVQVTVAALSGTFPLAPVNFSAQATSGGNFAALPAGSNQLGNAALSAGRQLQGRIEFLVPRGQQIAAIVYTTSLGEQLGLWSVA